MGASLKTTNYELPIFAANDTVGFATPNTFNTAMDKIDTQMAANAASADQAVHTANNAEASANAAQTAVGNANTNITRLNNQMAEVQASLDFSIITPNTGSGTQITRMVASSDYSILAFSYGIRNNLLTSSFNILIDGNTYKHHKLESYTGKLVDATMTLNSATNTYSGNFYTIGSILVSGITSVDSKSLALPVIIFYSATENKTYVSFYLSLAENNTCSASTNGVFFKTGGIIDPNPVGL